MGGYTSPDPPSGYPGVKGGCISAGCTGIPGASGGIERGVHTESCQTRKSPQRVSVYITFRLLSLGLSFHLAIYSALTLPTSSPSLPHSPYLPSRPHSPYSPLSPSFSLPPPSLPHSPYLPPLSLILPTSPLSPPHSPYLPPLSLILPIL